MTKRTVRAGFVGVLVLLAAVVSRAQYEHPDLKSGKVAVHKLLIIPPEVSVTKAGMKGNEGLVAEAETVENALPGMISHALQAKGCTVVENALTADAIDKNQELKTALSDLQTHFDATHKHVAEKPKDVRNGRYTMGDEVDNFPPGAAADALVFTRASGVLTTGGKKAFAAVVGGNGNDFIRMDFTLIDSQSGNVLLFTEGAAGGNFVGDTNRMRKPIEHAFKDFACGPPSEKKK